MMNNRPIGLLDSGVGGLSVVKKVLQKMPHESTVFIGDNANIPYGDKSQADIIDLTRQSVKFLLSKNVKLIIFACNTATAAAMATIQQEVDQQIVGVIQSGGLLAAQTTHNKKVAVVATNYTISHHAYQQEINFRDPEIKVTELAAPKLVPLIEQDADEATCLEAVKSTLAPIMTQEFDTLVLGCTHYPLIKAQFAQALGDKVKLVDPADQVAQYTANVMERDGLLSTADNQPAHEYYTTGDVAMFNELGSKFLNDPAFKAQHLIKGEDY